MKAWILDKDIGVDSLDGQAFAITPDNSVIPIEAGILLFAGSSVLLSPDGNIFFNSADSLDPISSPEQAPLFAHHSQSGSDQFGHVESIDERTDISETITEIEEFFYFTSQYEAIARTHDLAHLTPELKQNEQVSLSGVPEGTVFTDRSGDEYVIDSTGTIDISALDSSTLKMFPPADAADFELSIDIIVREHFKLDPMDNRFGIDTENSVNVSLSQYTDVTAGGDRVIITNLPTGTVLTDIFGYSVTVSEEGVAELSDLELSYITLVTPNALVNPINFDVVIIHSSSSTVLALEAPAATVHLSELLPTVQTELSGLPAGTEVYDANGQGILTDNKGRVDLSGMDINTLVISPPADSRYFEAEFTSTVSVYDGKENTSGAIDAIVEKNAVAIIHDALIIPGNQGIADLSALIPAAAGEGTLTLSQLPTGSFIIDANEHHISPDAGGTLELSYPVVGNLLLSTPDYHETLELIAEIRTPEQIGNWTTDFFVEPTPFFSIDEFGSADVTHFIPQVVLPTTVNFDLASLIDDVTCDDGIILFGLPEGACVDDDKGHYLIVGENEQADITGFDPGSIQVQLPVAALAEPQVVDIVIKAEGVSADTAILQPGYSGEVDLSAFFDDIDVSDLQINANAVNVPNSSITGIHSHMNADTVQDPLAIESGSMIEDELGRDLLSDSSDYLIWDADEDGIDIPVLNEVSEPESELAGAILNLSDLMMDEDNHSLEQYLRFEADGNGNTIVEIASQNEYETDHKVILHGVDLSVYGDDSAIIARLMQDTNLDFDW